MITVAGITAVGITGGFVAGGFVAGGFVAGGLVAGGFVVAAGAGALVRHAAVWLARSTSRRAPAAGVRRPAFAVLGTLAVNLVGSFLLGSLAGWDPPGATVVGTAGLGALTTFSGFSSEVVALWHRHRVVAVTYVAVSIAGGVALAWLGLRWAR